MAQTLNSSREFTEAAAPDEGHLMILFPGVLQPKSDVHV